jgi:hypothetical protein
VDSTDQQEQDVRISASQIKTWHEICPRRWYYERYRPRTQNDAAAAGERMHTVLENWLQFGAAPDLSTDAGRTAVAGLGLIPPPLHAQVEIGLTIPYRDGITYTGRVDFTAGYTRDRGGHVVVGDHKSIGSLARAKTTEDLAHDPQWIIYGHWAAEYYEVERVTGQWVYYQRTTMRRKRGTARKVEISATRSELADAFASQHERKSLPIAHAKRSGEIPPRNLASCHLFPPHGCPYQRECHATGGGVDPLERLHASIFG